MNPVELRYEIYKYLVGRGIDISALVSPVPGEPLSISLATDDPYSPGKTRYFRITVEEQAL